jgi:hypothetical protein
MVYYVQTLLDMWILLLGLDIEACENSASHETTVKVHRGAQLLLQRRCDSLTAASMTILIAAVKGRAACAAAGHSPTDVDAACGGPVSGALAAVGADPGCCSVRREVATCKQMSTRSSVLATTE